MMKSRDTLDVAVVGGGVSGLIAALLLRRLGGFRVTVFDQGLDYESRVLMADRGEASHLSGIGGAGTLGGGKLCGMPASGKLWALTGRGNSSYREFLSFLPVPPDAMSVLGETLHICPKDSDDAVVRKRYPCALLYQASMRQFVRNLLLAADIEGVTVEQGSKVTHVKRCANGFELEVNGHQLRSAMVIAATGRSGALGLPQLLRELPVRMIAQPPDVGVRLEIPQAETNTFVPVGLDVKLKRLYKHLMVRTFCVCTGGSGVEVDLSGTRYFDGHFGLSASSVIDLGVMARAKHVMGTAAALRYCRALGNGPSCDMTLADLLRDPEGLLLSNYRGVYGDVVRSVSAFARDLVRIGAIGCRPQDCRLLLPAIDRYWPRVMVNRHFETHCPGLYVVGDAAGISRGYIQALWSGWCAARQILESAGFVCDTEPVVNLNRERVQNVA